MFIEKYACAIFSFFSIISGWILSQFQLFVYSTEQIKINLNNYK